MHNTVLIIEVVIRCLFAFLFLKLERKTRNNTSCLTFSISADILPFLEAVSCSYFRSLLTSRCHRKIKPRNISFLSHRWHIPKGIWTCLKQTNKQKSSKKGAWRPASLMSEVCFHQSEWGRGDRFHGVDTMHRCDAVVTGTDLTVTNTFCIPKE